MGLSAPPPPTIPPPPPPPSDPSLMLGQQQAMEQRQKANAGPGFGGTIKGSAMGVAPPVLGSATASPLGGVTKPLGS